MSRHTSIVGVVLTDAWFDLRLRRCLQIVQASMAVPQDESRTLLSELESIITQLKHTRVISNT